MVGFISRFINNFNDRKKCCKKNNKTKEIKKCWKHYIFDFVKVYLPIGIIINFTLSSLLHFSFTVYSPMAYGFLYYFITDEFPSWIKSIYPEKWRMYQ